jgi:hypothetical protein
MITNKFRRTPDIYPLDHIRVVDGDTLEALIRLPFDQSVTKRIRLKGWWAPEPTGPYAAAGIAARLRLVDFVKDKALWLHTPSCRLDRYGRVVGHMLHGERIVSPRDVLGDFQLSESEHKRRRDLEKKVIQPAFDPADRCPNCGLGFDPGTHWCPSCYPQRQFP